MNEWFGLSVAKLIVELPTDIGQDDRCKILQDVERGRGQLIFIMSLKLASYTRPRALLFGLGHHDMVKARQALRVCLASGCSHPQIRRLQRPPLRGEAEEFMAGGRTVWSPGGVQGFAANRRSDKFWKLIS